MAASNNSPTSYWLNFFQSAGIPSKVSLQYAKLFVEHRIQKWQLADLNKVLLKEIGVTAVGDVLAILRFASQEIEKMSLEKLGISNGEKSQTIHKSNLKRTSEGIFAQEHSAKSLPNDQLTKKHAADFGPSLKKKKVIVNSELGRMVRASKDKKSSILDRLGDVTVTVQKAGGRVTFSTETKEEEVTSTTNGFTALESDKLLLYQTKGSVNSRLGAKKDVPRFNEGSKRVVVSMTSNPILSHRTGYSSAKCRLGSIKGITKLSDTRRAGSGVFERLGQKTSL